MKAQLGQLQKMYEKYKDSGFSVIALPSNQFNGQEPLANEEIGAWYQEQYGVTFPILAKADVNGKDTAPLFQYLKERKKGLLSKEIKWNYTKFLVDRQGQVYKRYGPQTEPVKLEEDIERLLEQTLPL